MLDQLIDVGVDLASNVLLDDADQHGRQRGLDFGQQVAPRLACSLGHGASRRPLDVLVAHLGKLEFGRLGKRLLASSPDVGELEHRRLVHIRDARQVGHDGRLVRVHRYRLLQGRIQRFAVPLGVGTDHALARRICPRIKNRIGNSRVDLLVTVDRYHAGAHQTIDVLLLHTPMSSVLNLIHRHR